MRESSLELIFKYIKFELTKNGQVIKKTICKLISFFANTLNINIFEIKFFEGFGINFISQIYNMITIRPDF